MVVVVKGHPGNFKAGDEVFITTGPLAGKRGLIRWTTRRETMDRPCLVTVWVYEMSGTWLLRTQQVRHITHGERHRLAQRLAERMDLASM